MTVDAKHKAYSAALAGWTKVRDFVAGGARVKPYVQTLPGHDGDTASAFRNRAYYLPAIARSIDAFTGMVMNPEPVIQSPETLQPYLDDVSYDGEPANRMIGRTVRETVEVGRCAVLVDYPSNPEGAQMSVAEAEALGLRAYARFYAAEDVLDWRVTARGGERVLSFLKLKESHEERDPQNEWTTVTADQIRVLDLTEGKYRVRIYRKGLIDDPAAKGGKKEAWQQVGGDVFPMAGGKTLDEIPAVVFNPDSLDASEVDTPPVAEMVEIADAFLNDSALRQWALLWVGNPTPVFRGLRLADGESVKLGSSQGIAVDADGGAEMLFLPADGVGAIRQAMEDKRRDMAAVGARLLADETSAQIARDTAVIQRAGEHSVLAQLATTIADGWQRVLGYLAMWGGIAGDISVKLNTDFLPQGMTSGELSELIQAVQAGQMSSRDLFALLQKRGLVRPDKAYEEHLDEVDEDGQRVLSLPPGAPGAPQVPPANDQNQDNNQDQGQAA